MVLNISKQFLHFIFKIFVICLRGLHGLSVLQKSKKKNQYSPSKKETAHSFQRILLCDHDLWIVI